VLPVGGIKEKTIAAARAGIKRVILPARNRRDLEEIPQSTRAALQFVFVDHVAQALDVAFGGDASTDGPTPPEPSRSRTPAAPTRKEGPRQPEASLGPAS